jgi:hypothetical protein
MGKGQRSDTERTPELSQEEWKQRVVGFLESRHCTMFGRAMPSAMPDEREDAAEWYAELIMRAGTKNFGD